VRGVLTVGAAAVAEARVPRRRARHRRQAVRPAGGHLRPPVRAAVRARHVRRDDRLRTRGGSAFPRRRSVTRDTQNILLLLLGGALLKIAFTGDYLRYVKGTQLPWIVAAGLVTVVLAAVAIATDVRSAARSGANDPATNDPATNDPATNDPAGTA